MTQIIRLTQCYVYMVLFFLLAIGLIGCGFDEENIEELEIEHIEIAARKIKTTNYFAVNVVVIAVLPDGCHEHKKTYYPKRDSGGINGHSLWRKGDVIEIKMTGYALRSAHCTDAVEFYRESIFIGYCLPGDYVVNVNGNRKIFRVPNES